MRTIHEFVDEVVQPNMQAFLEEPDDLRASVNAVLTLDALAGVIYSAMKQVGHRMICGLKTDDKFRDLLADSSHEFRVLRDLAASYKHGELTNPKPQQPRLLHGPEDMTEVDNVLGTFGCGDRIGGNVLMIALDDGRHLRASQAVGGSYQLLRPLVDELVAP